MVWGLWGLIGLARHLRHWLKKVSMRNGKILGLYQRAESCCRTTGIMFLLEV
jgi:hypothetical protein